MSDLDYYRENKRCSITLKNIEDARKKLEKVGLKIPDHLEEKINSAKSQRAEAEKKFSYPYRKVGEAIDGMRDAANSANDPLEQVYEFYFGSLYLKACDVVTRLQGNEDIVVKYIKNYEKHSKNFSDIKKRRESNEKLSWKQVGSDCEQLQSFLDAFELFKQIIFAEINREEEKKKAAEESLKKNPDNRGFWSRILEGVLIFVAGSIILSILCTLGGLVIKSCVLDTSSTQPAQPETELQSEANNSTPAP